VLEKEGDVAAVIGETVRCTPFIPPADYWKRVRAACDKHGALLILDEIPIGLGRTGRMFACEHYEVVPDMLVLGKGLGGGVFPMAALLARESLNVATRTALGHYTHEKNPVGCAAGLATLDVIRDERLVEHAARLGDHALGKLQDMKSRHPLIGDVRGKGLLLGIELIRGATAGVTGRTSSDVATNPPPHAGDHLPATEAAEQVMYAALKLGLNFKVTMGNILTLTPALTLTRDELDQALTILDTCIGGVQEGKS
jgi:4-aminobutyrate aminotransferase